MFKALTVVRASAMALAVGLSVGLSFAPDALAQSASFTVRDADNPARAAFQIGLCTIGWPSGCGSTPSNYRVPTGHRLVIEFVSAICQVGTVTERIGSVVVTTVVGGNVATHYLIPIASAGQIERSSYVSQTTRIYADADTTVSTNASSNNADVGCRIGLSGSLIRL